MSMIPLFPFLMPPVTNSRFETDVPCDEEAEVQQIETEHQNWVNAIQQTASDLNPIGGPSAEHLDNDTDDEDDQDGRIINLTA